MASRAERPSIEALARRVRRIERGAAAGRPAPPPVATGWAALDGPLGGGLATGAVHEWLGLDDAAGAARTRGGLAAWTPPLALLAELAGRALEGHRASDGREGWVVWIGARVWPYPRTLGVREAVRAHPADEAAIERARELGSERARGRAVLEGLRLAVECDPHAAADDRALFERSLFVDPADLDARVWAADGALRCPTVAAVVLDGRGLRMPAGRRLQLAAEAGGGFCLVARPADEAREVSAATSRWRVRRAAPGATVDGFTDLGPDGAARGNPGRSGTAAAGPRLDGPMVDGPMVDGPELDGRGSGFAALARGARVTRVPDDHGAPPRPAWELELLRLKAGLEVGPDAGFAGSGFAASGGESGSAPNGSSVSGAPFEDPASARAARTG